MRWAFGGRTGEVRADARGVVTVPRLTVTGTPATLTLTKAK